MSPKCGTMKCSCVSWSCMSFCSCSVSLEKFLHFVRISFLRSSSNQHAQLLRTQIFIFPSPRIYSKTRTFTWWCWSCFWTDACAWKNPSYHVCFCLRLNSSFRAEKLKKRSDSSDSDLHAKRKMARTSPSNKSKKKRSRTKNGTHFFYFLVWHAMKFSIHMMIQHK